jgi:hypothetical protein
MKSVEASVTSTLGAVGEAIMSALEPPSASAATASPALTPMVPSAPASLSRDDIASALPGLSAIIAWLAKNASAIQAGATIAEKFADLAALFNVPGAADAALGIELAAEDIPTIVAVGQTVLPLLSTLAPLVEPAKPDDPVSTDDPEKYSRGR